MHLSVYNGLNSSKDGESSCNHLVAAVKLGQDCVGVGNVHCNEFNHRGRPVKAVSGVFNPKKD